MHRYNYDTCKRKAQCRVNKLFTPGRVENNGDYFPLNLSVLQREKKELINIDSKISTYILYQVSGYFMQALDDVEIIYYDRKIYVPQIMLRRVLDWYNFYLNHFSGSRLAKTIQEVFY